LCKQQSLSQSPLTKYYNTAYLWAVLLSRKD